MIRYERSTELLSKHIVSCGRGSGVDLTCYRVSRRSAILIALILLLLAPLVTLPATDAPAPPLKK